MYIASLRAATLRVAALVICLCLNACDTPPSSVTERKEARQSKPEAASVLSRPFLKAPIDAAITETPLEALPYWRTFEAQSPGLVIFTDNPPFAAVPTALEAEAKVLAQSATAQKLWDVTPYSTSNPVLLQEMAIRPAISAGFFSEIIWVPPLTQESSQNLTLEALRGYLVDQKLLSADEAALLSKAPHGFTGAIGGIPLSIMFPDRIDLSQKGPLVFHFDLDYLVSLYKSEVKTPIYSLLHDFLADLEGRDLEVFTATVSLSNFGGRLPLQFRFLGPALADILRNPAILQEGIPKNWALRREILYLENFFQPERILELANEMVARDGNDPVAQFTLYRALKMNKSDSFPALDKAIRLDTGYALEYLSLADTAHANGSHRNELVYLQKALSHLGDDPVIRLRMIQTLRENNLAKEAEALRGKLAALEWSEIYFPEIPDKLAN